LIHGSAAGILQHGQFVFGLDIDAASVPRTLSLPAFTPAS